MKKAFKIIIPILLALALIASSVWYLFVYDKEFTQDVLLRCARFFEGNGSHDTAQWFYNLAYEQSNDNDSVAIELAEQYKEIGNYTKAEYTLYNAIQDGGGVELYIALCKTYVEQDKLLDALNLMQNATGEVKEQLEAIRPADPEASYAPGTYSEYISIEFSVPDGKVYVTTEAVECPSMSTDAYKKPIPLNQGSNIIYAINVGDNGLVSPLRTFEYVLGGIIEEVKFSDKAMEAAIRAVLNVAEDAVIYTNELWSITEFTVPENAKVYSDLRYLNNLEKITINKGEPAQIKEILSCPALKSLSITDTNIDDETLQIIGTFTNLQELTLSGCNLASASKLSNLINLVKVDLSNNTIRDLSIFSNMAALEELSMAHNAIEDLRPLASCNSLTSVNVGYNNLGTIDPLFELPVLTYIDAQHNTLSSLSGVEKLQNLTYLYASFNGITDVSPLSSCVNLRELDVSDNLLKDISSLSALNGLMYLNFAYNDVTQIPTWDSKAMLVTIDGSYNKITSLEPLKGLHALNNVLMDYNKELTSVDCLVGCHALIKVNVYGTKVTDVSALNGTDPETGLPYGVVVNYDPTQASVTESTESTESTEVQEDN